MTSANSYPLELTVYVDDSLGGRSESVTTVITQSPFDAITDTNALTQALAETVTHGVKAAIAVGDYSNLATQVDVGNSLIEKALAHAHSSDTIDAVAVETIAADLTIDLLGNITSHLDDFDFFLTKDRSLFRSGIQICHSFADGFVLQSLNRSDVIAAGNIYATALNALFDQSSGKTLTSATKILQCFDSIITAVEKLPPSPSPVSGRRLQVVSNAATLNSTLSLLADFKDLMVLGETRVNSDTLNSVAYYVEKSWPFRLAATGAGVFPAESREQSASSVGSADFQAAVDLFDLTLASQYTVDLFSINGLDEATCEYDMDPCI